MDSVVILLDFWDDTWTVTPPMPRWCAEWELRRIGEFGMPYDGKRVTQALLVPEVTPWPAFSTPPSAWS